MNNVQKLLLTVPIIMFGLLGQISTAHADYGRRHYQDYDRLRSNRADHRHGYGYSSYPLGRVAIALPRGYISLAYGRDRYYYHSGVFYKHGPRDYVVVAPPRGVVISSIPSGHRQVIINGRLYYTYDDVYYIREANGYKVVDPPKMAINQRTMYPGANNQQEYTVNVANAQGTYTAVTLKRSGEGYVGPQGEYYPEFPSIEQLQAMYARK